MKNMKEAIRSIGIWHPVIVIYEGGFKAFFGTFEDYNYSRLKGGFAFDIIDAKIPRSQRRMYINPGATHMIYDPSNDYYERNGIVDETHNRKRVYK